MEKLSCEFAWALLTVLDSTTLILSSSVWGSNWACTLQEAGTTKHKTIFKRNATNVCIHIFSVLEEKR